MKQVDLFYRKKIRDKVGIINDAIFIASGDTFQIWHPDTYTQHNLEIDSWYDQQDSDFDPLFLLEGEDLD
jgi:MraZ protein